ncbi:uncharacterized protein si:ch211-195o20.7 isoform X6 [Hypomesus transpacificus]|uniref:uncharacterized protein si:ch211-195o20.7 isoform X6 n=1 Tax=Hypomesus transpacificus TaxID=137520 RepID=UPI001F084873|nr:uncharacterized protein si:ch211-195o20.7 isoform X6 [Hypomesus transpacificus]
MGNFSSKDGHGPTGPHQDIFHTPPTSPAAADPPTVPKLTLPHPDQPRSSALSTGGKKSPPFSDFIPSTPASDWKPLMPVTPDCSVIGPTSSTQQEKLKCTVTPEEQVAVGCNNGLSSSTPSAHAQQGKTKMTSPNQPNQSPSFLDSSSSLVSLSGQSWKERDSGLSQSLLMGPVSRDSQGEMERLVEECRTTLGLSDSKDKTVAGVLKSLLTEICCLRETIQTERVERGEWLQFQSDLQVAVTVADRLRSEAEEELSALRTAHRDTERELAAAQQRQKETDIQMVTLRGELRESRQRKASLAQAQGRIEAQAPNPAHTHTKANVETHALESQFGRGRERAICKIGRGGKGEGMEKGSQNEKMKNVVEEESHIDVKGVVKRYLRNVTNEERSGEEGCAPIETRRIGTTERSRILLHDIIEACPDFPSPRISLLLRMEPPSSLLPQQQVPQTRILINQGQEKTWNIRTVGPALTQGSRKRLSTSTILHFQTCPQAADPRMGSTCCSGVMEAPRETLCCAGVRVARRATRTLTSPTSAAAGQMVWPSVLSIIPTSLHTSPTAPSALRAKRTSAWLL